MEPDKNPFNIDVKIISMERYDKSGAQITLKCLNNLGVTGFLPPPGGAHEAISTTSDTYINKNFFKS